jgi:hypothetical protein
LDPALLLAPFARSSAPSHSKKHCESRARLPKAFSVSSERCDPAFSLLAKSRQKAKLKIKNSKKSDFEGFQSVFFIFQMCEVGGLAIVHKTT